MIDGLIERLIETGPFVNYGICSRRKSIALTDCLRILMLDTIQLLTSNTKGYTCGWVTYVLIDKFSDCGLYRSIF